MNCKQIEKEIRKAFAADVLRAPEVLEHLNQCGACREAINLELLINRMIRSKVDVDEEESRGYRNPFIIGRIRNRIREIGEQGYSWEAAVLALRSWLLVFGSVALILVSFSFRWPVTDEAVTPPSKMHVELTAINDEIGMENMNDLDVLNKDKRKRSGNAHK